MKDKTKTDSWRCHLLPENGHNQQQMSKKNKGTEKQKKEQKSQERPVGLKLFAVGCSMSPFQMNGWMCLFVNMCHKNEINTTIRTQEESDY